jgi:NTE family protein
MKIDGVFSGGGIRGFALVGACEEIEKRGFHFVRLAGTSAGSIVAALVAAGYTSKEMFQLMDEFEFNKMMDARKSFIPFARWLFLYWKLGLYKGNELENWLRQILEAKGIKTFSDLPPQALRVIASDISNGQMIVLPDDLERYGISPGSFSVARAVRMSCSIPYFFEPVKLRGVDGVNILVDGGVLSNFPIWLFDKDDRHKVRPVLGVKLSPNEYEHEKHRIDNAIQLFSALFETMKDAHDARYISKRHVKNIIFIPTDGIFPIESELTTERKKAIYEIGRQQAEQFFRTWCY